VPTKSPIHWYNFSLAVIDLNLFQQFAKLKPRCGTASMRTAAQRDDASKRSKASHANGPPLRDRRFGEVSP